MIIIWRRVFYWELNHSQIPYATSSGTRVAYFPYVTFVSVVSFNDGTIPPFAFVELVSPYNKKNITRWLEDMNFMFSWQEQYLSRSLRSLVRYCSCHENIKFISSRHRVISSIYGPKLSGFYTLSQTKLPKNHTLHSSTYPSSLYVGVPPPTQDYY